MLKIEEARNTIRHQTNNILATGFLRLLLGSDRFFWGDDQPGILRNFCHQTNNIV